MPTAVISALIKSGNLTHRVISPLPSTNPTESVCCIPQQAVDSALRGSTLRNGHFLILYRCSNTVFDPPRQPSNSSNWQQFDVYNGWEFELTLNGTVKYHGAYRRLVIDTEREWTKGTGEIRKLVNPCEISVPTEEQAVNQREGGEVSLVPSQSEYTKTRNDLTDSNDLQTYRFALYGLGDHVSVVSTIPTATGQGTWQRLVNEPEKSYKSTHVLYISLPELIGHIIACGVSAEDVPRSLQQGEWGCVKLGFPAVKWKGPENMRVGKDSKPKEDWKEGWWYSWRPAMEVWVC